MSQPGLLISVADKKAGKSNWVKQLEGDPSKLGKHHGISVQKDVVPGLMGDLVVAAYPSQEPAAGIDLLVEMDNQNGADPARLADKILPLLDESIQDGNKQHRAWYVRTNLNGGADYRLTPKVESDIHGWDKDDAKSPVRMSILLRNKTVAWATVGGSFYLATSQALLDRAVAAVDHRGPTLATDKTLVGGVERGAHDQMLGVGNLGRFSQGLRNTVNMSQGPAGYRSQVNAFVDLTGNVNAPLTVETSVEPDGTFSGSAFYPVDYERTIDFVGSLLDMKKSPPGAVAMK